MSDIVFKCQHCGVKLMGFSRRAGTHIVCPGCHKETLVPAVSDPSLVRSTHHGHAGENHGAYNPVHHHVIPEHVPRKVSMSMGSLFLMLAAALVVLAIVGYWSFNPGTFNPGRELPVKHMAPVHFAGTSAPPVEGQDWKSPLTGMEFVWVPAMRMWVGRYEVTNEEFLDMVPTHDSRGIDQFTFNGPRQPAVYISFDQARAYADWLSGEERAVLSGYRYRLPSGSEWETFARCGNDWTFPWGNQWPPVSGQAGNYHGEEGAGAWEKLAGYNDGHPVSCDVEKSWANPWNLHGVGGNVWEACVSDADAGVFGAWMGGSWNNCIIERMQVTNRIDKVGEPGLNMGFRLVMSR